jgi:TonB-linked SusC/RagA family outer membrane protein
MFFVVLKFIEIANPNCIFGNIARLCMNKLRTFFVFFFIGSLVFSQNGKATGVVLDQNLNEPLAGANVVLKGTSNGTITDFDGNFELSNIAIGDVLVFSYLGYENREITLSSLSGLKIYLQESLDALDEVVVIGYGTQRKKEITGAVAVVGAETIEDLKPTRIEQALQGQVAGVNVTSQSGSPGSGLDIRIRGISTNGDSRPLILVDGNVIEDLSVLNPGDIETLNVLKDATAGIYGVRAANGVILITTKQGRKNTKLQFAYDAYGGFQETTRKIPVLNAMEYAAIINEAAAAGGQPNPFPNFLGLGAGTDWQDEVFQKALTHNHNLTASGGTKKSAYSFGLSWLTQDGIVGGDKANFTRYTARANFDTNLLENLKLTTNIIYNNTERSALAESGLGSVLFNALNNAPTFDIRDDNGDFTLSNGLGNEVINPLAQIENTFNRTRVDRLSAKIALNYKFWNNFTAEAAAQGNYAEVQGRFFSPLSFFGAGKVFNNLDRPNLAVNKDIFRDYTFDAFVNYKNQFNSVHNFQATIGTSVFVTQGLFSGSTQGFFENPTILFEDAQIADAVDVRNGLKDSGLSGRFDERLLSYFTRLQYDYDGKYLVSAVVRRDGSTKFGPDNRFGYFTTGSVGWIASEESFLEESETVSFLKFRGSYGVIGNDRIASNAFRSILTGEGVYVFNDELVFGQAVGVLSNPLIKWEGQKSFDVGLDMKLFNNAVDITADYYKKITDDLLLQPQVSGILGATAPGAQAPVVNGGSVENSGFEFAVGYNWSPSEDFSVGLNYNVTFLENEVTAVNNDSGFLQGGSFGVGQDPPARFQAGKPIGFFFGLETDGIFQNQAEVDAHATQMNAAPGDLRFVDQNNDGLINSEDRTDIGNPIPDATMGLNLSVNYKNFDFGAYAFSSIGNEIVRNYERDQPLVNRSIFTLNRWTGEGSTNTFPRVTSGATSNSLFSDYFVEDGTFLRIQNAQIGYTLPSEVVEKIKADNLRFYISANNIYTFTKYRGFDPSASSGAPIGSGIDFGFYPVPRTYLLGLNLKF